MPEPSADQQLAQLEQGLRERHYSTAYGNVGEQALLIRDDLFKALGERNAEVERLRAALSELVRLKDHPDHDDPRLKPEKNAAWDVARAATLSGLRGGGLVMPTISQRIDAEREEKNRWKARAQHLQAEVERLKGGMSVKVREGIPEDTSHPCNICGRGWPYHHDACVYLHTAREVERLRAENTYMKDTSPALGAENMRLQAEVERLRAALERIADWHLTDSDDAARLRTVARAAITSPAEPKWVGRIGEGLPGKRTYRPQYDETNTDSAEVDSE